MALQDLLAGGVEYVQDSQPSNADAGEIWLDTSVDPSALKIYDASSDVWDEAQASNLDAPVSNIQDELQNGRTRGLLLLLQDKPVPEVQDPLNIQSGLSSNYKTDSNGDYIKRLAASSTTSRTSDNNSLSTISSSGLKINPNNNLGGVAAEISSDQSTVNRVELQDSTGTELVSKTGTWSSGDIVSISYTMSAGTDYYIVQTNDDGKGGYYSASDQFPYTGTDIDIVAGKENGSDVTNRSLAFNNLDALIGDGITSITDQFAAPTTAPADFKQWESIQAQGVTTGGSTSADPVEFEILDSTDTVLNSSRIPKARIADEPFTMRSRVYSEDVGSDGQSDYTIATTGDGGHYGIPILTVVSAKKNGSVLDSANWSFDPDTDTVTIDTSNVTITSGDTIDIKYDFDVFNSTLQPRAYLNRASTSETSPSISHFVYEYVI